MYVYKTLSLRLKLQLLSLHTSQAHIFIERPLSLGCIVVIRRYEMIKSKILFQIHNIISVFLVKSQIIFFD